MDLLQQPIPVCPPVPDGSECVRAYGALRDNTTWPGAIPGTYVQHNAQLSAAEQLCSGNVEFDQHTQQEQHQVAGLVVW